MKDSYSKSGEKWVIILMQIIFVSQGNLDQETKSNSSQSCQRHHKKLCSNATYYMKMRRRRRMSIMFIFKRVYRLFVGQLTMHVINA